jgi:hypothetical protein
MTLDLIDCLISIQKKQVALGIKIPTEVDFYLTDRDLAKVIWQINHLTKLNLSPELLADLRYYILLQNQITADFALTFTTYYVEQQQKIAVIQSVISLQGNVSQQICRRFLDRPQLLNDLVVSHYWLITQICDRLSLKYKNKSFLLAWSFSLMITAIFAPFCFYWLALDWAIELIIVLTIFCLVYFSINLIIQKYLPTFILQQLLFGFFSKNVARKRLGLILLSYFG